MLIPNHVCRQGASVEAIVEEVNKRKSALENARKELKMMVSLNKVGHESFENSRFRPLTSTGNCSLYGSLSRSALRVGMSSAVISPFDARFTSLIIFPIVDISERYSSTMSTAACSLRYGHTVKLKSHCGIDLDVQVQTDDLAGTQGGGNREKDPRSLSGGEKSFSTICLLLSLWESIGCPIRCLGEPCHTLRTRLFLITHDPSSRRVRRVHGRCKSSH